MHDARTHARTHPTCLPVRSGSSSLVDKSPLRSSSISSKTTSMWLYVLVGRESTLSGLSGVRMQRGHSKAESAMNWEVTATKALLWAAFSQRNQPQTAKTHSAVALRAWGHHRRRNVASWPVRSRTRKSRFDTTTMRHRQQQQQQQQQHRESVKSLGHAPAHAADLHYYFFRPARTEERACMRHTNALERAAGRDRNHMRIRTHAHTHTHTHKN